LKTILNFIFNEVCCIHRAPGAPPGASSVVVCHCEAINDRTIRHAVRGGACTRKAVALACGAGRTCGGCVPVVDEIIACEVQQTRSTASPDPSIELAATG